MYARHGRPEIQESWLAAEPVEFGSGRQWRAGQQLAAWTRRSGNQGARGRQKQREVLKPAVLNLQVLVPGCGTKRGAG
ncbi:hypothetical protein MY1884_007166 [Beauveria asiatica]